VLSPDSDFAKRMGTVVISGHYVLALTCDTLLEGTANQVVVTNDATSYLVRDIAKKHKAIVKEVEVGEINVVKEMEVNNSIIGGEGSCSGVIILPIKCRDGIMSVVLILKMLAERQTSLSAILKDYPQYFSARALLSCQPQDTPLVKSKIEDYFREQGRKIQKTGDRTGGLKILFDDNSFLWCRESKTEPGIFRIHAEADQNQTKVNGLLEEGIKVFYEILRITNKNENTNNGINE
jgi:phosphomannomutase/phosphoglucomutase